MKKSIERFSGRVDDYVKYRPAYPDGVLKLLQSQCGLDRGTTVADIGSGTGIFTQMLLQTGCRAFGVEPNRQMRAAAESLLGDQPGFTSVDGTAEQTGLADHSVDLITAAQAFHWFDRERTKIEFRRIARPGARLAVLWNTRLTVETPFLVAYERLLTRCANDYRAVDHRNITIEAIADFFAPASFESASFRNSQRFNFQGLAGRLMSSSYAPSESEARHAEMMEQLRRIFSEHQSAGKVEFLYRTVVYFGFIS